MDVGQKIINNKTNIIKIITIFIIVFISIFIISKVSTQSSNCSKIASSKNITKFVSISNKNQTCLNNKGKIKDLLLNQVFVKTAHDCCCSGDYKNDYVDLCALINCRDEGVRALDFQIYSLLKKPIIAAASVPGNKYKEIYNSLDFYTTMQEVKRRFLTSECSNFSDPLFLIFRVNSALQATYDSMFSSLLEIFGSGSTTGNILYINRTTDIGLVKLSDLINQVVICVYAYDAPTFYKSQLTTITSLDLNTAKNKIRYETELLDKQLTILPTDVVGSILSTTTNIAFPNQQSSSANMDFVMTGLYYGITFIGMNFQKADSGRVSYDKFFSKGGNGSGCSFIEKLTPAQIRNSALLDIKGNKTLYSINLLDKIAVLN
jgi:hypothetical protein